MKTLFYLVMSLLTLVSSIVGTIVGMCMMAYQIYTGKYEFLPAYTTMALSLVLFLVTVTAYMITKVMTSTEIIAESLIKLIQMDSGIAPQNPLGALFGGLVNGPGTIQVSKMDDDGKLVPFAEKQFSTPEEFIKYRNELVAKALSKDGGKKKLEDMSIEELTKEEKKAVESQDFETAAAIVSLIEEKKRTQS